MPAGVAQLTFAVIWPGDIVGIVLGAVATAVGILLVVAWLPQPPPSGAVCQLFCRRSSPAAFCLGRGSHGTTHRPKLSDQVSEKSLPSDKS